MEHYQDSELYQHCLEVQSIAETRLKGMMKQFELHNPPPNRNTNGLAWATHMGILKRLHRRNHIHRTDLRIASSKNGHLVYVSVFA